MHTLVTMINLHSTAFTLIDTVFGVNMESKDISSIESSRALSDNISTTMCCNSENVSHKVYIMNSYKSTTRPFLPQLR
jgi:hypothetical protein